MQAGCPTPATKATKATKATTTRNRLSEADDAAGD